MPLIATRGAASARGFGMFAAVSDSYWIATLSNASNNARGKRIALDSAKNIYVVGYEIDLSYNYQVFITKYNPSGVIQWQRYLGSARSGFGSGVAVDSSNNIYFTGYIDELPPAGANLKASIVAKYNSSGTLQWQRILRDTVTTAGVYGNGIAVDSSSNVYVTGYYYNGANYDILLYKLNSSGTIQYQKSISTSYFDMSDSITVDSSGNIYIVGSFNDITGPFKILITKIDSTGSSITWQRSLDDSGNNDNDFGRDIAVDSSGNVYVVGDSFLTSSCIIAKYNSSGTIQWQRLLGGTGFGGSTNGYGIALDSSGNVYVTGANSNNATDCIFAKYNSSGTIQYQRSLSSSNADYGYGLTVDLSGNSVYITGIGNGATNILITKLPGDGSKTGTYSPYSYGASTLTDQAASLTSGTSSLSLGTTSLTADTSSYTDATTSLTSTVITI
ncbi:MAG: hypothetical protein EBR82_67325 [Caulobacteraceae bacterium]|nr:hypothetical protein [Caulobacteraceae bacterium]